MEFHTHKTDILILGSGGAGLFAALHASKANPDLDITIAIKGLLGKCGCTRMVQGGYNVALSPGDSVELANYRIRYLTADPIPAQHYGGAKARLALYQEERPLKTLTPEKRIYWLEQQPASIPSGFRVE